MTFEPAVHYVEVDIPPGMTCAEYRRQLRTTRTHAHPRVWRFRRLRVRRAAPGE